MRSCVGHDSTYLSGGRASVGGSGPLARGAFGLWQKDGQINARGARGRPPPLSEGGKNSGQRLAQSPVGGWRPLSISLSAPALLRLAHRHGRRQVTYGCAHVSSVQWPVRCTVSVHSVENFFARLRRAVSLISNIHSEMFTKSSVSVSKT